MKERRLLYAIGWVEDRYIEEMEKDAVRHRSKRLWLLVAVIALAALLVGCGIVYALSLYNSPQDMISSIFGDRTGFDHKEITYLENPDKPNSPIQSPAYDRVPADTKAVEAVAPLVTVVGKSITLNDYTLTIDGFLYDSATQCGLVTFRVDGKNGLPEFILNPDGEIDLNLVRFNQYGYSYLIQDKSTENSVAAIYYFRYDPYYDETFSVCLYDDFGLDFNEISQQVMTEMKQTYSAEAAKAEARAVWGDEYFENFVNQVKDYYSEAEAAYMLLRDDWLNHADIWGKKSEAIDFDCSRNTELKNITIGSAILISPISIKVDTTKLSFLEKSDSDEIQELRIFFTDGSEYILEAQGIDNRIFALGSDRQADQTINTTLLTCMFNRIIDLDKVSAVKINDITLSVN